MKKGIKVFLMIFLILVIVVLVDTMQAKVFDNNSLIKIRYNRDGGNIDYIDKGIFVYTYVFTNGEKVTVFRWEKYAPPEEPVDLQIDNINSNQNDNGKKEQYFFGKVIESNTNYIIVEPNEDEEIRKSSDEIDIGLRESNDTLYEVGTNVKITYEGPIMESYYIIVEPNEDEEKGIDYNVYAFEGHIAINLNTDSSELTENSISLRDALLQNKITINEIIEKANKDLNENLITGDMYKDGGSMIYQYSSYTIIKCHTLNGNRDVYIGAKDMTINDLEI